MFEHVSDPATRKILRSQKTPTAQEIDYLILGMQGALEADKNNEDVDFAVWQLRHAAFNNVLFEANNADWKQAHKFAQEYWTV